MRRFIASPSSISEIFTKAMKRLKGLPHYKYGAHALRHSYGLFLANKIPLGDGIEGMRIELVKEIMGHSLVASTQIYAPTDRAKIMEVFARANELIMSNLACMTEIETNIMRYKLAVPREERRKLQLNERDYDGLDSN